MTTEYHSPINYRDYARDLIEIYNMDPKEMLMNCLKYMSNDDIMDMLSYNNYPDPLAECDEDSRSYDYIPHRY